jgi:hypothetical protein
MDKDRKEYYQFVFTSSIKALIWLAAIVGGYFLFEKFVPHQWNQYLAPFTKNPELIFIIFFTSETLFGIIPLEFFILWAKKEPLLTYIFYVILLSVLSYFGAFVAYWAGTQAKRFTFLKRLTQLDSFQYYANIYSKFGGFVIILSALTPLPFATISFLSATFQFPVKKYILYSATRFARFALLGWFLWTVGN